ncbi:RHS repeat-associated core domain-containing protein [Pseudomonas sp. N3-W]|uniref:RHS repeat-associated core domain-containing protein n=1 Tax=Pseudomonas sp. N3-W TaxID=2975049 RepID=UPI00217DDB60|nr:RHS repeat-associated core domain-containing protein [Pseudomonas sp. N3-W]UWF48894.1 RHS repeat-associated core domain-containing protein [Pseudomonas sp. N3-W]
MDANRLVVLCRYHYDPLDRLVASTPAAQPGTQRFYQKDHLATEIQGALQHSIMQHDDHLLAQQQYQSGTVQTRLLATDQQRSVLNALDATQPQPIAYTPYGHRPQENGLLSLPGFNGERPDPLTGHYLLGNGYRAFNPVLMRFNSPDSWSPFGEGGFNTYAYCENDPINYADPSGNLKLFFFARRLFNQPDISGALFRVKKSLGSIKKANAKMKAIAAPIAERTPRETVPPSPLSTQQTNAPATNKTLIEGANPRKDPSTLAHKGTNKASIAKSNAALPPIHNYAAPGEWDVQLIPVPLPPTINRSPLRPVHNYAASDEWNVRLTPDSMQPVVRLIRMKD